MTDEAEVITLDGERRKEIYKLIRNYAQGLARPDTDIDSTVRNLVVDLKEMIAQDARIEEWLHDPSQRMTAFMETLKERIESPGLPGTPTGFRMLDLALGGWKPKKMYGFIALPSMGKTALMQQLAYIAAKSGKILYFSPEAEDEELRVRLVSGISKVPAKNIDYGNVNSFQMDMVAKACREIKNVPLYTFDMPSVLAEHVELMVRREKPAGIFLDYIQQMGGPDDFDTITNNMKALEQIGKENNIYIVFATQAKRGQQGDAVDMRSAKGSGKIEELSHALIWIHRDKQKAPAVAKLTFLKNRDGEDHTITLQFDGDCTWFSEPDQYRRA